MKAILLLAGAAALGIAAPSVAQHNGRHDNGNHYGQMRGHHQRLARGQRFRSGYGTAYSYNRIPMNLRTRYHLNSRYHYYYDNGYYYAVDPTTMVVAQVISALTR